MKEKGNGYGSGTWLETRYALSPAYLSLGVPGTSRSVSSFSCQMLSLFLLKRQFTKQPGKKGTKERVRIDGNKLTLTYKELEARGVSQTRATRAFDELLAKGFIKIEHQGGAFDKDKTVYALADDFVRWRPGYPPIYERIRDVRRGYQGKVNKRPALKMVGKK